MGLRCFFLPHEVDARDWHRCIHCKEILPKVDDPLTFEEGFEHGLKEAANTLYSLADELEDNPSFERRDIVSRLRQVAHTLKYRLL
jgi:hypothetical protein